MSLNKKRQASTNEVIEHQSHLKKSRNIIDKKIKQCDNSNQEERFSVSQTSQIQNENMRTGRTSEKQPSYSSVVRNLPTLNVNRNLQTQIQKNETAETKFQQKKMEIISQKEMIQFNSLRQT